MSNDAIQLGGTMELRTGAKASVNSTGLSKLASLKLSKGTRRLDTLLYRRDVSASLSVGLNREKRKAMVEAENSEKT